MTPTLVVSEAGCLCSRAPPPCCHPCCSGRLRGRGQDPSAPLPAPLPHAGGWEGCGKRRLHVVLLYLWGRAPPCSTAGTAFTCSVTLCCTCRPMYDPIGRPGGACLIVDPLFGARTHAVNPVPCKQPLLRLPPPAVCGPVAGQQEGLPRLQARRGEGARGGTFGRRAWGGGRWRGRGGGGPRSGSGPRPRGEQVQNGFYDGDVLSSRVQGEG